MKHETPAPSNSFGQLLRDFRLAAGLSQGMLAERARMSLGGVSVLERGARRSPHRETIALLAEGLNLPAEDRARLEAAAAVRTAQARRRKGTARADSVPHNLPAELTSFVGRESEISEIASLLDNQRLVTLAGIGGVGKTRTALQVARQILEGAESEVWLVDLSSVTDATVAASIAQTLDLEESASYRPLDALIAHLHQKTVLLVLDNCERVVSAVASVAREIVGTCSNVRILATSRAPLRVGGEHVYRLPPMPASEATALFADRAAAVDHRFAVTEENARLVARICQRLDGIPLAIELAAARIRVLPLELLFEKLDQRLAILTAGHRDVSPRHRTIRALIDWSYDFLAESEQRVFEGLSVFAGGCTLEAAASVCLTGEIGAADLFDLLASLVDNSLVVADLHGSEPRYLLLESMREYARNKLSERGELRSARQRHALAYYRLAASTDYTTDIAKWASESKRNLDNWRAALDWTLNSRGDPELGIRLAGTLRPVWSRLSPSDGRYWLTIAHNHVNEKTPLPTLAWLEFAEAKIAQSFSESRRALDKGRRALHHFRAIGDQYGIAQAQHVVGYALFALGSVDEAEPLIRAAVDSAKRNGFRWLAAGSLESLGLLHSNRREFEQAQQCIYEAIAIFREIGDLGDLAAAYSNLAEARFVVGDVPGAVRLAKQAIEAFSGRDHSKPLILNNLAAYLTAQSRYDEARCHAREALELAHQLGLEVALSWSLQHIAAITILRRRSEKDADRGFFDAARLLGFVGRQLASFGSAREYTEQQEYDRAIAVLQAQIGSERLEELMASGVFMDEEHAVELADALQ